MLHLATPALHVTRKSNFAGLAGRPRENVRRHRKSIFHLADRFAPARPELQMPAGWRKNSNLRIPIAYVDLLLRVYPGAQVDYLNVDRLPLICFAQYQRTTLITPVGFHSIHILEINDRIYEELERIIQSDCQS